MKKNMIIAALVLLAVGVSSSAFASKTINPGTTMGGLTFKTSSNVYILASATPGAYIAESLHKSGSRVFGTDSKASVVFWKDVSIASTSPTTSFDTLTAPAAVGGTYAPDFATGFQQL